jgi:glutamate racemase
MGCTHYPLLKASIKKVFGNYVTLVDSGEAIALQLLADFKNQSIQPASPNETHYLKIALTDFSEQFENLSNELLCTVMTGQIDFETVSVI